MLTWLLPRLFSTSGRLAAILACWSVSEHRRWIISVFDRRSIMNRLYWHNQQVGFLCFIPFVREQRGVIAAVADQTAMISHLLPMCWATRGWSWGHVGAVWEPRIDTVARVIVALDCTSNFVKYTCILFFKWKLIVGSGHNISYYTTAQLSVHVRNHDLICDKKMYITTIFFFTRLRLRALKP